MPWWTPYLPRPVAARLLTRAGDPRERPRRVIGAALFADVSGFTALSEALAPLGASGAEILTHALNDAFDPLITEVEVHGGWVGAFGGDAMTAVFEGPDALLDAAACALELQAAIARRGERVLEGGVRATLGIKVGIAPGAIDLAVAGDPEVQLVTLIGGPAVDAAARAEHGAAPGEVLTAAPEPALTLEPRAHGWRVLDAPLRPARTRKPIADGDHAAGAAFLPRAIAARLRSGAGRFVHEHRRVVAVFLRVEDRPFDELVAWAAGLVAVVDRFGGYVNKVSLGDKGTTALVLFGAPVSHEDDPERALRCLLALSAVAPIAAGAHAGFVYAGDFGTDERREYTVIGDVVNVAARLMQAAGAPGTALVSDELRARVRGFAFAPPRAVSVKGRAGSVGVAALVGAGDGDTAGVDDGPLIGRATERARLLDAARAARDGAGGVLAVQGEPGIGKSRLVADVARELARGGAVVSTAACRAYLSEPYAVWRPILRALLGLGADAGPAEVEARVRAVDPGLVVRTPLLAGPLGVPIPTSRVVEGLDEGTRARATADLVARLLAAHAASVVVLEDAHAMDPASRRLLTALVPLLRPLRALVLLVGRPDDDGLCVAVGAPVTTIGPLSRDEMSALVAARSGGEVIPAAAVDRITERAQGNPYYVEELLALVRQRGGDPARSETWSELALPTSVEALVQARIDRLAEDDKLTLKAASVIGRRFRLGWLHAAAPELGDAATLERHLEVLARLELTPVEDAVRRVWSFRHPVVRQVAYDTLSVRTRTGLHRRLAHVLARDPSADPVVIAWHCSRTDDVEAQRTWYRRAGDAAARANDADTALSWYERWLPIGTDADRDAVLCAMATMAARQGRDAQAEAWWSEALSLALAQADAATATRARIGLSGLRNAQGRTAEAEALLERALADSARDGVDPQLRVDALAGLAQSWRETRPADAERAALDGYALAETLGDPWSAGRAAFRVGLTLLRRPESVADAEPWLVRAQRLSEAAEDPVGVARAASNRAVACWWTGRAAEATELWGRSISELLRVGDEPAAWTAFGNLAQVHLNRRSVGTTRALQALRCDHETALGRWGSATAGLPSLLQVAYFHPDLWDCAAEHAPLVVEIARAVGTPTWRATALASAVLVAWRTGRDAQALAWTRECLEIPPGGLVDEAHGWVACWGALAARRAGTWTEGDARAVARAAATAGERTLAFFDAAAVVAGTADPDALARLDAACAAHGDVFLHAVREVLTGRPMDPPPPLAAPPDLGVPPEYPALFAAIRARWAARTAVTAG